MQNGRNISLTELLREMGGAAINSKWNALGKQHVGRNGNRGYTCGYIQTGNPDTDKIAFAATIRAASGRQKGLCRADASAAEQGKFPAVRIETSDIRYRRFVRKEKMGILFVVDASRSQGADRRLAFAKGAILSLLRQVYERRDKAGLIIFGDKKAELVLPFTRSVEYAGKKLASLPASGNTPLAMGLRKALKTIDIEQRKDDSVNPMLVLVTDGKANYDDKGGSPLESSMEIAGEIRKSGIPAVVIDTEKGIFRLGIAKRLAEQLDALYLTLE